MENKQNTLPVDENVDNIRGVTKNFDHVPLSEYRVRVTVRNNLILTAIENAGYKNISAFCKGSDIPPTTLSALIAMKVPPLMSSGEFSKPAKSLMEALCALPTELWTSEQLTMKLKRNTSEMALNLSGMQSALGIHADEAMLLLTQSPEEVLNTKDVSTLVEQTLNTLSRREAKVLRMRFGIGCEEHTLEEVGACLDLSKERVRQIEAKSMRKLRHPSRMGSLDQLTEYYKADGIAKFNLD
jgi:RNA polymerase sigma factor (sigma-70 family)